MFVIMTIDELLLYSGWSFGPNYESSLGVCELLKLDSRECDGLDLVRTSLFDAQWIAVPEEIAEALGILSAPTDFATRREEKRTDQGYQISRAIALEPSFVKHLYVQEQPLICCDPVFTQGTCSEPAVDAPIEFETSPPF